MKTLGDYYALSCLMFGEDSEASKFLDRKITDQGRDQRVLADESQMMYLLHSFHSDTKPNPL